MPEVLIRNADYVVTVDKDRRMIRDGAIAISGNTIVAVGKTSEVAPRYPNAEVIDARGKLAMPGIFDTHIHNAQQLGRGLGGRSDIGPRAALQEAVGRGIAHGCRRCVVRGAPVPARIDTRGNDVLRRSGQLLWCGDRAGGW